MSELSANVELLFTEWGSTADRVRAAAALGLPAVEIWAWRDKDLTRLAEALDDSGVALHTMCVEPMGQLTDPSTHGAFLAALKESAAVADRLACPYLVVTAGDTLPAAPRELQRQAVVSALRDAAGTLTSHNAVLLLENLNSRVDHVGTFLDSTVECLDILDEVGSPHVKLLYDLYHSLMMEQRPEAVLDGRVEQVAHVQIADIPGRHEPGSGAVDWRHELSTLRQLGYRGRIGLEYVPAVGTVSSMRAIRGLSNTDDANVGHVR